MRPRAYLALLMVAFPVLVILPTHALLTALFPRVSASSVDYTLPFDQRRQVGGLARPDSPTH